MINSRGTHALPVPNSARVLLWYGWRDDPENEGEKWFKKWFVKLTYQCSKMLLDGSRCHRKTVLGTDYCFAHLAKLGIREIPTYKSNHKSRVIDTISRIISVGNFF